MGFDCIFRLLFLVQNVVGPLGHAIVLTVSASMSYISQESRPTRLILTNIAIGNFFILLFKGIVYICGITHILRIHWFKVLVYIYKVGQHLSLCTTCLLSNFQAMSISPRVCVWMGLKIQVWRISISCFLCWISSFLINTFGPIYIECFQHEQNSTKMWDFRLCISQVSRISEGRYRVLITLSDYILIGLMVCASFYMVLLLYRYQGRVRLFESFSISKRLSSKAKATQSILLLISIFILFNFTKSILILKNDAKFVSQYLI
jgi:vomeronasal1 receptor